MSRAVFDTSAILAILCAEPGRDVALAHLPGAVVSTVNLAEVFSKATESGLGLEPVRRAVKKLQLTEIEFDGEQAFITGTLREKTRSLGLSLGDRACFALALSRGLPVLTGDKLWAEVNVGVEVILFR